MLSLWEMLEGSRGLGICVISRPHPDRPRWKILGDVEHNPTTFNYLRRLASANSPYVIHVSSEVYSLELAGPRRATRSPNPTE
jgi:hypothetical protein